MSEKPAFNKYEFKRKLEAIRSKKGRGTELISLYIPHDKQIPDVTHQLKNEHGQASNIKSKMTKTNVQGALDSLLSRIRYNKAPENGIVYFTGAVDVGANKTSMETIIVEPPFPITSYKYHCDSTFYLEPLEEMLKDVKTYGLLVLDMREATVGLLVGKKIETYRKLTSSVPGKQRKGGQSAQRFQQLRLIAIHDFFKRIGDAASDVFMAVDHKNFEGVLLGGPSPTKEKFDSGDFLHHELLKKKLGLFDVSYTDESGLPELVDAAGDKLSDIELMAEKKIMQRFLSELVSDSEKAVYGIKQVQENLKVGAVEMLIISEDVRATTTNLNCNSCGFSNEIQNKMNRCPECKSDNISVKTIDAVNELIDICEEMKTEVAFISTDFEEGSQLLNAFGGIVALLRYKTGI
ncbi:MAG: peptide chain release factor aRF-1 [Methanosarcinaceae archaeon]|nr:peptide chain release factor aRF-1 [Methanosarcinaceae archaeon]